MKDKMKGLLIGILIGVVLSGSAAYAGGATVEVVFKKIKIMIDGVEKPPADGTFIYNNKVYVPIRYAGELMGKNVDWDGSTGTVWIGGKGGKEIVAVYRDGQVSKDELDRYLAITRWFNPQYENYERDMAYVEFMLEQLIGYDILARQADESARAEAEARATAELDAIRAHVNALVGTADEFASSLAQNQLAESDVYDYLLAIFTGNAAVERQVTGEQIAARFAADLAADPDMYTLATVSHILIAFADRNGGERTKEEALAIAEDVRVKLDAGGDFAALAGEYSDDPGSAGNGGTYADQPVSGWVSGFKEAVLTLPPAVVSEPVETEFGYHLIRVDSRAVLTADELEAELRSQLASAELNRFFADELSGLIRSMNIPRPE